MKKLFTAILLLSTANLFAQVHTTKGKEFWFRPRRAADRSGNSAVRERARRRGR